MSEIKGSLLKELLKELQEAPEDALALLHLLDKIVKPWETTHMTGTQYTTIARATVLGKEVAVIKKDYPKWKITIESQQLSNTPTVLHQKDAEDAAKKYADDTLKEKGYIVLNLNKE